ncbi:MAG: hypothetical protein ACKV22_19725 [Bryobacteraceae bacterium]
MSLATKCCLGLASGFCLILLLAQRPSPISSILGQIASGKLDPGPVVVEYRDLHAMHGGLNLTIRGTGEVEQEAVRAPVGQAKRVSGDDLLRLVRLLSTQQVWQQRIPQRTPVPDESRAYLTVRYREDRAEIWEWYNDLEKNRRILPIRELMKQIAWQSPPLR